MDSLLPEPEKGWLLDSLAALIRRCGDERFLTALLLEPREEFFPDPWEPSASGVEVLARRLLTYAGLPDLEPCISTFSQPDEVRELDQYGGAAKWGHEGAAAWFSGIEGRRCFFGVAVERIGEPEIIVSTLCHEVAHAWRHVHGIAIGDRATEERLTDLTTIYLGFGVLTTNGAYMYRASSREEGARSYTQWSHTRGGYLSPEAMGFLLAAQVHARGYPWKERRRIAALLEPNQKAAFQSALRQFKRDGGLGSRVTLQPSTAPSGTRPAGPTQTFALRQAPPAGEDELLPSRHNQGRHVYRVRRRKTFPFAMLGLLVGLGLGVVGQRVAQRATFLTGGLLAGAVLGGAFGRRRGWDYCSDPACRGDLAAGDEACPRCGGWIRAEISDPRERMSRDDDDDPKEYLN